MESECVEYVVNFGVKFFFLKYSSSPLIVHTQVTAAPPPTAIFSGARRGRVHEVDTGQANTQLCLRVMLLVMLDCAFRSSAPISLRDPRCQPWPPWCTMSAQRSPLQSPSISPRGRRSCISPPRQVLGEIESTALPSLSYSTHQ